MILRTTTWRRVAALAAVAATLVGCASTPPKPYDYTAYRAANPQSILVLPPLNSSPDVKASNSVWAQAVFPLAESGYYVMPLSLAVSPIQPGPKGVGVTYTVFAKYIDGAMSPLSVVVVVW